MPKPLWSLARRCTQRLSASLFRPSTPLPIALPRDICGCFHVFRDQRLRARALRRAPRARSRGSPRAAPHPRPAREQPGRAPGLRGRRRQERLQEGQAEDAADLLAPVRDDDRGGSQHRRGARDPRAADRRPLLRHRRQGAARRRRRRPPPLAGDAAASEDLRPPLRLDGRGGRGGGNPGRGARPRRVPDREVHADQTPRQGSDALSDDGARLRDPRAHRPAHVPRAGVREDLRPARRSAPDTDAVRRRRLRSCCARSTTSSSPSWAR